MKLGPWYFFFIWKLLVCYKDDSAHIAGVWAQYIFEVLRRKMIFYRIPLTLINIRRGLYSFKKTFLSDLFFGFFSVFCYGGRYLYLWGRGEVYTVLQCSTF